MKDLSMAALRARRERAKAGLPLDEDGCQETPPGRSPLADCPTEDASYVAHDYWAWVALADLRDYALNGGLWEDAWHGLLENYSGYSLDTVDKAIGELTRRGLVDRRWRQAGPMEDLFYSPTPRGLAALERAEAASAEEHGELTIEDLWAHDVLVVEGPLPRDRWRQIADDPSKGGYTTDFEASAARLLGRLCVELREDGTYASIRPPMVMPEDRKAA